jgi:hypothetical protein
MVKARHTHICVFDALLASATRRLLSKSAPVDPAKRLSLQLAPSHPALLTESAVVNMQNARHHIFATRGSADVHDLSAWSSTSVPTTAVGRRASWCKFALRDVCAPNCREITTDHASHSIMLPPRRLSGNASLEARASQSIWMGAGRSTAQAVQLNTCLK